MRTKLLVLHSGGLDSTVCLLMAKQKGFDVESLGIDYGQRHRVELVYADHQCKIQNIPRTVLSIGWKKPERIIPNHRSVEEIKEGGVSSAFLPGRNLLFFSLAACHAAGVGATEVWVGINSIDSSGYPDCTPDFFEQFIISLERGTQDPPKFRAPLLSMSKPEIAEQAHRLGLSRGSTWSCYTPSFTDDGIKECGKCDACKLNVYAWASVNVHQDRAGGDQE